MVILPLLDLYISESLFIKNHTPSLNRDQSSIPGVRKLSDVADQHVIFPMCHGPVYNIYYIVHHKENHKKFFCKRFSKFLVNFLVVSI